MDPLTAIGAVASIAQLAHTAFSLSKTLYTLSTAISSASEDIEALAEDLRTFSQSLRLLSRLLEDSKSWYSDDIYLLTAKVIKDCTDLYIKIDKVLVKLGANGKSTWKLRVKYVYKEGQIRKLMKRLRDMKGTLATILMSLQVDLQLSLLNISTTSRIQRPAQTPLQPETIETLKQAQGAIEAGGILPKYVERESEFSEKTLIVAVVPQSSTDQEQLTKRPAISSTENVIEMGASNESNIAQSFVVLPSQSHEFPDIENMNTSKNTDTSTRNLQQKIKDDIQDNKNFSEEQTAATIKSKSTPTQSLKSSASSESFKSAISVQDGTLDLARKVKAVQSVLHAFRTALQILNDLIDNRIHDADSELYFAAKGLKASLQEGSMGIDRTHTLNFKKYGNEYLQSFTDYHSAKIQQISSTVMQDIVMKLHEYSAEHEDLEKSSIDILYACSEKCCARMMRYLEHLTIMVPSNGVLDFDFRMNTPEHEISPELRPLPMGILSSSLMHQAGSTPQECNDNPEPSLPFVGYTFKRFDSSYLLESPHEKQPKNTLGSLLNAEDSSMRETQMPTSSDQGEELISSQGTDFGVPTFPAVTNYERNSMIEGTHRDISETQSYDPKRYTEMEGNSVNDIQRPMVFLPQPPASARPPMNSSEPFNGSPLFSKLYSSLSMAVESENEPDTTKKDPITDKQKATTSTFSVEDSDMFQNFDFDAFLNTSESSTFHDGIGTEDFRIELPKWSNDSILPALVSPPIDEPPRYVNRKQFHRILKRRATRKAFTDMLSPKDNPSAYDKNIIYEDSFTNVPSIGPKHNVTKSMASMKPQLALSHIALSNQPTTLWWQAYINLQGSNPKTFYLLDTELDEKIYAHIRKPGHEDTISDDQIRSYISVFYHKLSNSKQKDSVRIEGIDEVLDMRDKIVKIITTFDVQLGLHVAALGWACVWAFIDIHNNIFHFTERKIPDAANIFMVSFSQVQEIVAVIARYAVMENLYQQSGGELSLSLSLTPEYQDVLVSLCSNILEYFAEAFTLARMWQEQRSSDEIALSRKKCEDLVRQLKDKASQGFRVVVETKEDSDSDTDEMEIEDLSDGSWEEIDPEADRGNGGSSSGAGMD